MYTFEVYPALERIPQVEEVIDLAQALMLRRLEEMQLNGALLLSAVPAAKAANRGTSARSMDADWWFTVGGHPAGVEMRYHDDETDIRLFRDEILWSGALPEATVDNCLRHGRMWSFRSSTGHAAVGELAFGYLAAALAELTQGFVYSDDGAWDRKLMPMLPDTFYGNYLRAETTSGEWAHRSHEWASEIRRELR